MGRALALAVLLVWGGVAMAGDIVRCVDPVTKAVTFSDRPCTTGPGQRVQGTGNVMLSAPLRAEMARKQAAEEQETREREALSARNQQRVSEAQNERSKAAWDKICREGTRPYKGSPNGQLTAAQIKLKMRCAGYDVPDDESASTTTSIPAPTPAPSVITSCDGGGCWDNQGGRYTRGAGTTYFGPNGACQLINGQMQCP